MKHLPQIAMLRHIRYLSFTYQLVHLLGYLCGLHALDALQKSFCIRRIVLLWYIVFAPGSFYPLLFSLFTLIEPIFYLQRYKKKSRSIWRRTGKFVLMIVNFARARSRSIKHEQALLYSHLIATLTDFWPIFTMAIEPGCRFVLIIAAPLWLSHHCLWWRRWGQSSHWML